MHDKPTKRPDIPQAGYYLLRLVRNGPWVGAAISVDDAGFWSVMIDGKHEGPSASPWSLPMIEQVHFYGRPSTESEVKYRVGVKRWAEIYAPSSAAANPYKPIDLANSPVVF